MSNLTIAEFILKAKKGHFFSIKFQKRTNNEIRMMLCKCGVKKHLHGGVLAYNPIEKNLLNVFDMGKVDYRSINLEGLLTLKIDGAIYDWYEGEKIFKQRS